MNSSQDFIIRNGVLTKYTGPGGDVVIPDDVLEIDSYTFSRCHALTSVTIPASVKKIGSGVFSFCQDLTKVNIPEGVTVIEDWTFSYCRSLINVIIPAGAASIESHAFYNCTGLTSVTLPASVTKIERSAFEACTSLTEIFVDANNPVYRSENGMLLSNNTLLLCGKGRTGNITIPAGVTEIGADAFEGCEKVTGVTIPEEVTVIGNGAFTGCTGLASFTFPKSLVSVDCSAFRGTPWLENASGLVIAGQVLLDYKGKDTEAVIPEGVTVINAEAFNGCTSLTGVTIPNGVAVIDDTAFCCCTNLTRLTLPESLISIGHSAFYCCKDLTRLTLPEGLTSIGHSAFLGCAGLTSVTIPESVTAIGCDAFNGCTGLTSVTLPKNVKEIGSGAFSACSKLASVTMWASSLTENACWMFGRNGRTMPMVLLREGKEPFRTVAVFRREYYVQSWTCKKNILTPLDPEDAALYDTLIADGECEGFKITNDGRIRAMVLRLLDPEHPVERDMRAVFAGFLSGQVNKVLKYAQADGEPAYIRALRDVGAVSEEGRLRKKLASSKDPAFVRLAEELDASAPMAEGPAGEAAR